MYRIIFEIDIKKYLKKLPKNDTENIINAIGALAHDPRPRGFQKLRNRSGYRIRVGNYRIIYTIEDGQLIISVIDVDNRKDIYK